MHVNVDVGLAPAPGQGLGGFTRSQASLQPQSPRSPPPMDTNDVSRMPQPTINRGSASNGIRSGSDSNDNGHSARSGRGQGQNKAPSVFDFKYLVIEVKDSGAGISPENIEKLFGRYVQFNAGALQNGGGSGLGLWISKGIIDMHGMCPSTTYVPTTRVV